MLPKAAGPIAGRNIARSWSSSIILNRPIEQFSIINDGEGLVDARNRGQIALQAFYSFKEVESQRAAFATAIDDHIEVLSAADFLAYDLVRLPYGRGLPEILDEVQVSPDARYSPYARDHEKQRPDHYLAPIPLIETADYLQPDAQAARILPPRNLTGKRQDRQNRRYQGEHDSGQTDEADGGIKPERADRRDTTHKQGNEPDDRGEGGDGDWNANAAQHPRNDLPPGSSLAY